MKNLIKIVALALLVLSFNGVNAQSDQSLIGKARLAAHDCLQEHAGADINAFVETTGICFAGGSTHKVTFTAGPRCNGTGPCPYFVMLVATVYFDCEGNIISTDCQ